MIDINELRQSLGAVQPEEVSELLDRLEEAEAEALEQARLNGMGSEREAALMAKLEAAERERDECNARRLEAADHFSAQVREISSALEETRRERDVEEQRACDLHVECCNLITEIDALRAKITEMEQQAPVAIVESWANGSYSRNYKLRWLRDVNEGAKIYALPGAKGE